jgi:hypothetical protein
VAFKQYIEAKISLSPAASIIVSAIFVALANCTVFFLFLLAADLTADLIMEN